MGGSYLPEHVQANRRYWDDMADQWVASGERLWKSEPQWGQWGVPNTEAPLLSDSLSGQDAIELGCGTGYVSAWMVRRGAVVTAVDNSANQLATCRRLQIEHGLDFETLHGNAETLPFADECFDFAISEYGAAIWADPYRWIPEAHRLLRSGGRLVFLGNSPLQMLCVPADGSETTSQLERPYFGMHRFDWRTVEANPGGVEFNLTISAWIQLFSQTGFIVENCLELVAPKDAQGAPFGVSAEWARSYPSEQVWMLRKQTESMA